MASCSRLHPQRSFCRRATLPCDHDKAAGGPFFPKTTITQQAEPFNFAATALRRRNCNTLQRRKLESDAAPLRQILLQASYSTCRNDGTAVILDFRPRLANRCSKEVKTRAIRAAILDFKPRLANRCSQKVKTRAIRAAILDFKPKLANRCSAEVKTGVIPAAQGRSIMPRPGNAGWAGTSDGVAARGFVNGEGPTAQRWEGKHRRCAPVRSPCPQADSATKRRPCPQADAAAGNPPQAESAARTPSTTQKKESRLIAESGLSKRGSYLLSHLV